LRAWRGSIPCWRSLRVRVWGDGPCGRAAGEERAGAWVAGVRGGGVELGADEGGEPGREEDRDGIEPQARVGAVLLDVGGGESGQA
jgi:hypothetical protein